MSRNKLVSNTGARVRFVPTKNYKLTQAFLNLSQEMFAAHSANPHLAAAAAADPYNVSNTLHNFQTTQVNKQNIDLFIVRPSDFAVYSNQRQGKL